MICFQISIFEPLETTHVRGINLKRRLWFAFKLVSLNHWKQRHPARGDTIMVVICFQISIFEPLETTHCSTNSLLGELWFAFKLVSLNHWKQPFRACRDITHVVICFQISIFEPLETTKSTTSRISLVLWFAFKLVSLNHWKQQLIKYSFWRNSCDLLSN